MQSNEEDALGLRNVTTGVTKIFCVPLSLSNAVITVGPGVFLLKEWQLCLILELMCQSLVVIDLHVCPV